MESAFPKVFENLISCKVSRRQYRIILYVLFRVGVERIGLNLSTYSVKYDARRGERKKRAF